MRTLALLSCLSALACAHAPLPPLLVMAPARVEPLPAKCPYAGVYLAVLSNGEGTEARIAQDMQLAYARHLADRGFQVLTSQQGAYWDAFSLIATGEKLHAHFAWSVYVMATVDATGDRHTPRRFALAGDEGADLSGFMFLKQVAIHEIDAEARKAAMETAGALLPHAHQLCQSWAEAKTVREELAQEMRRVRALRDEREKSLELEPEASAPSS